MVETRNGTTYICAPPIRALKETIMGVFVMNLELVCDHATPEKYSAVRFHIDLPVDYEEIPSIHQHLASENWSQVRTLLAERYPQHAALIDRWIEGCQERAHPRRHLAVANG
jgi:hypothetical protein